MARNQGQKTQQSIIWGNQPSTDDYGQYYYDPTSEFFEYIYPGVGDPLDSTDDLYSKVYEENEGDSLDNSNIRSWVNPIFWQYQGLSIRIEDAYIKNNYGAGGDSQDTIIGIYFVDENSPVGQDVVSATTGIQIQDALGTQSIFSGIGDYREEGGAATTDRMVYYYDTGPQHGGYRHGDWGAHDINAWVANFPYSPISHPGTSLEAAENWPGGMVTDSNFICRNMTAFSEQINKNSSTSGNYLLIFRLSAFYEEQFYHNIDRLNRSYQVFKIPKSYFKDLLLYNDVHHINLVWGTDLNFGIGGGYYDYLNENISSFEPAPIPQKMEDDYGSGDEGGEPWDVFGWIDDKQAAMWKVSGLRVSLFSSDDLNEGPKTGEAYRFRTELYNELDGVSYFPSEDIGCDYLDTSYNINWPIWIPNEGSAEESYTTFNHYYGFSPNTWLDYASLEQYKFNPPEDFINFTEDCIEDFRPMSWAYTQGRGIERSLQRKYLPDSVAFEESSAPNTVFLQFDIAKSVTDFTPDYLDEQKWVGSKNRDNICGYDIGYKFTVVRWGDSRTEPNDYDDPWTGEFEGIEKEMDEMTVGDITEFNSRGNYIWQDVRLDTEDSPYGSLYHQYNLPGIYTIKALVFSYIKHPNPLNEAGELLTDNEGNYRELIMPLRWKQIEIVIELNTADAYLEDFSELGGPDYVTIPWPYYGKTPIISGISKNSNYYKSVENTANGSKFDTDETFQYTLVKRASKNDELGKFIGKIDLEQTRVFLSGKYDMAYFLNIESDMIRTDKLYSYKNSLYWDGIYNKFPEETSVDSIFINDEMNLELKSDCILEFNYGLSEAGNVIDTSGNGNKGILIGDYSIKKKSKDIPLSRETAMDIPKTDDEDTAL